MKLYFFSLISWFYVLFGFSTSLSAQEQPKTIHVLVSLCDNKYQGIVKVPEGIGNGQNPRTNLYWGCGYGISTFFKKSTSWKEVKREKINDVCMERVVFKHKTAPYYLIADAYNGKEIKTCTLDFITSLSGTKNDNIEEDGVTLGLYGNAQLVAYIGHNGLMDFTIPHVYQNVDSKVRDAIILACASKQYFKTHLQLAKANPVLWTTNFMAPEAYTLHDALEAYIKGASANDIRESAAQAYNKYQKCGMKGSRNLLVT